MGLPVCFLFWGLFLTTTASAATFTETPDLALAISDMRSKSYDGFVILLAMLNRTSKWKLGRDATFFMPSSQQLGDSQISRDGLLEFIHSHSIPEPISFTSLSHVPTGTLIPTFMHGRLLKISTQGGQVFVNNAEIVAPDVCRGASIKCHGIDTVIVDREND